MPALKVAPTKTNLLKAREGLKLATEGHDLLDEKREVLLMELMAIVHDLKRVREEGEQKLEQAYSALGSTLVSLGQENVERIASTMKQEVSLNILERSVMGVAIPTIRLNSEEGTEEILLSETNSAYDLARKRFAELVPTLIRWAEIEISAFRLAIELKKMQRRVKALENMFIPEYESTIATIEKILEEIEREEFFRKKIMKRKLERTRGIQSHV